MLIKEAVNSGIFFTAGGLLLISLLLFINLFIHRIEKKSSANIDLMQLSWKNGIRNRLRSLSIISIFAIGTFLVISTGANRKDLFVNEGDRTCGTGGFLFIAESTVPVLKNINTQTVRNEYGLEQDFQIVSFRKSEGDDASCLNLNRVSNPQILGVSPEKLSGRFSFVSKTSFLNEADPWETLSRPLPGGLIPAIADQTVIKWGLGMSVGDTLVYSNERGEPLKLLLVGGLANSIFQGNVIIADSCFLSNFPTNSGAHFFLVNGDTEKQAAIETELNRTFRDLGWDMIPAARKLAEFNSVENTYLSIFLIMGALGLFIGTVGLGIVLLRSLLERRNEIALLRAIGYGRMLIFNMILTEYLTLLMVGICSGFISATIATLPALLSPNTDISFQTIFLILLILFLNGCLWIVLFSGNLIIDKRINAALRNE